MCQFENLIMPTRILLSEGTEHTERILDFEPQQAMPIESGNAEDGYAVIKKGGFVLLDFGREIHGGIAICVRDISTFPSTLKARVVFGESAMEAMSSVGYKNATNDHAIRDTVIDLPVMGNVYFGNTGFRFFKLEALDGDVVIKSIKAASHSRNIPRVGSFECSDERLNEIWRTGAYTVELNMGEYIWDGIKRDRLVWLGDMHPECSTVYAVYGADESIKNSLDFVKSETKPGEWINMIPSYSFWYVINQYEWYMHTGDRDYLASQIDYIKEIISHGYGILLENPENFYFFVDWSSNSDEGAKRVGFYAVMRLAFCACEKIAKLFCDAELLGICKSGIEKTDGLSLAIPNQKQMAGIGAYAGLFDPRAANSEVLSVNPLSGLSTFMGYYVLLAKGMAGDVSGALDIIRGYWGAMLDLGATTFFEDFDIDWCKNAARLDEITPEGKIDVHGDYGKFCYLGYRHSLCHGWASGPTAFLTEYVLGVSVAEPGCKKLVIKPNLCELEFARGSFPTPYGKVVIEHKRVGDRVVSLVNAPCGVEIEIIPPTA